jgi:hypothetical protein
MADGLKRLSVGPDVAVDHQSFVAEVGWRLG